MPMTLDNQQKELMAQANYPDKIPHWFDHDQTPIKGTIEKRNPHTGQVLALVANGTEEDVTKAIIRAKNTYKIWRNTTVVKRGEILRKVTQLLEARKDEIAAIVSLETGKSLKDALGEVGAAIEMGYFVAGEGRRFYGKTTVSGIEQREAKIIRQPLGVCALIIAANTPIANVAWKVYPALLCGNTAILKASEDTPYTALWFAKLLQEAGLPSGVLSVLQGEGKQVGALLVEHEDVALVSFTGSVGVGRWIQKTAGERLAKVCLELGGKNPLIVCDDADIDAAVEATVLSAFSNAGQRCASGSRIVIFESVYETFKEKLLAKTATLKLGNTNDDDYGPVINQRQLNNMLASVNQAIEKDGAVLLHGGKKCEDSNLAGGYYVEPTILENVSPEATISKTELFGPITCLYKVANYEEAVELANNSPFGLTAAIHTKSIHRAQAFQHDSLSGVVSINGPTYGSEPHMPFGGLRQSGNGWREAGSEALDVYSDLKTIYIKHSNAAL